MTPLHLGALHPIEQVLTLILAFGPFVVLGIVIWWRRRTEDAAQQPADQPEQAADDVGAEPQRER